MVRFFAPSGLVASSGFVASSRFVAAALVLMGLAAGPATAQVATPVEVPEAALDTLPSLRGTVRADAHGQSAALVGAVVEVRQGNRSRLVVVDSSGRYWIEGLNPGPALLRVFHVAAFPLDTEVLLPNEGEVTLDLSLGLRVITVPAVRVDAIPGLNEPVDPLDIADSRRVALTMRALEASTGIAESGLASAFPGDEGGEPERVLYLRGSTVDARLVLLDGAPILTPFHVAGLVEPFDSDLLGSASLYLGGAPSPYEGGISYVLDMDTRAPRTDRVRGSLSADGVAMRGVAELPLPLGGGLLLGARKLHGLQQRLIDDSGFPYEYGDLLVRLGFGGDGQAVRATMYTNREGVRLDHGQVDPTSIEDARWGNRVLSFGYAGLIDGIRVEAVAASSSYGSTLPVNWEDPVLARGEAERLRFGAQVAIPADGATIRLGGSLERVDFAYRLDRAGSGSTTLIASGEEEMGTTLGGVFGEWEGDLTPELRVRAGIRGDFFGHDAGARLGPRLQVRFALTDRAVLVGSGGRYHQILPAPGLQKETGGSAPDALEWEPGMPVVSATHLVLGLEQALDSNFRFGVSGFMKSFTGLATGPGDRSRSSGTELRVSHTGERLQAWVGYTLSWFWTEQPSGGVTRFDGRHLLSMGVEGTVRGLELRGTLGYGAGLPLTAIRGWAESPTSEAGMPQTDSVSPDTETRLNYGGGDTPLEVAPQDDFLRVDLEAGWPFDLRLMNRTAHLRPYVKLLNALDRRDALFYYFDRWRDEDLRPVTTRPFLPLVGVEWQF